METFRNVALLLNTVSITNRGIYIPMPQFSQGFQDVAVFGGLYASRRIRFWADRIQNATGMRPVTWYWRIADWQFAAGALVGIVAQYGGILAISKGQTEAAALGLSPARIMRRQSCPRRCG